ncbi:uncharacterized protein SCHCODRAFT_02510177 [Schizophyllum commune H4-8]|nr:uncharacterized protein SCHCODRAFT_02510177 [Schizophyllum commune H4-8]KAI5889019.1 hypothetical protein SCHCODRAFT_02510177 [Schizophyllum commune H4-8]
MTADFKFDNAKTQLFCAQRDILPTFLINTDEGKRGAAADQSVHDAIVRAHRLAAESWGGSPPTSPKRSSRVSRTPTSARSSATPSSSNNPLSYTCDTSRKSRRYSAPAIVDHHALEFEVNEVHEKIQRWAIRTQLQAEPAFPLSLPTDDDMESLPPSLPASPPSSPRRPKWRRMMSLSSLPARACRSSISSVAQTMSPTSPTWPSSPTSPTKETIYPKGKYSPTRRHTAPPALNYPSIDSIVSPTSPTFTSSDLPTCPTPGSPKSARTLTMSLRSLVRGRRRSDSTGSRLSDASDASRGSCVSAESGYSQFSDLTAFSRASGSTAATSLTSPTTCSGLYGSTIFEEPLAISEGFKPSMLAGKLEALAEEASSTHSKSDCEPDREKMGLPPRASQNLMDDNSSIRAVFREEQSMPSGPPPSRRTSKLIAVNPSQEELAKAFHEVHRPTPHPRVQPIAVPTTHSVTLATPICVTPSPTPAPRPPAPTPQVVQEPNHVVAIRAYALIHRSLAVFGWFAPVVWMAMLAIYTVILTTTALAGLHALTFEGTSALAKYLTRSRVYLPSFTEKSVRSGINASKQIEGA